MANYYNENDPKAAAWLRELIKAGLIAAGEVDERSIREVRGRELAGFRQCHFFAGIGGWSYALRLAGWPDNQAVWTGSCPCQPFSSAGKANGLCDERHLWPAFRGLIAECRPAIVFGEQVASADGRSWLAGVRSDLEGDGYAVGAADLCAAGVAAPHMRQRLYWVADAGPSQARNDPEREESPGKVAEIETFHNGEATVKSRGRGRTGGMAHAGSNGRAVQSESLRERNSGAGQSGARSAGRLDHAGRDGRSCDQRRPGTREESESARDGGVGLADRQRWVEGKRTAAAMGHRRSIESAGCWSDFELVPCRDGKARRIESGTFCMVDGLSDGVANCWHESHEAIKAKVETYAATKNQRPDQVLCVLREAVRAQFIQWCVGGLERLQAPAVLFVALCELTGELGAVFNGETSGVSKIQQGILRRLRHTEQFAGPSFGFELPEQCSGEFADLVPELSQEVASVASEVSKMIIHSYPLAHGIPGRVGLLRGYGNAIVPQVGAEFIGAWVEARHPKTQTQRPKDPKIQT